MLEVVAEEAPPRANAGFGAESPVGAGALLKRDGVCDDAPPGAAPNNPGLAEASAAVEGVLDSAGLFRPPNRLPVGAGAAGVVPPNAGLGAAAPPKRLLDGCEVVGVVDTAVEGVAEAGFAPPNRLFGAFDPGGGPAGVVELLPNREFPAGAGVAVEPAPPNNPPPVAGAPNNPLLAGCPGVVDSAVLLGVWLPAPPKRPPVAGVLLVLGAPKLKPELPPAGALVAPAFPKEGVLWPVAAFPPNKGLVVPAVEAPTFPKRPVPEALLSLLAPNALPADPNIPPPDAPVDAGGLKLNAMMWCWRGQGERSLR